MRIKAWGIGLAASTLLCAAAQATVITWGDVITDSTPTFIVGSRAAGGLSVDGGSTMQIERMALGDQFSATGTATVSGSGSRVSVLDSLHGGVSIGNGGKGTLQILAGGRFEVIPDPACGLCNTILGNAAGSSGNLIIRGAGSTFSTTRDVYVASTNVLSGSDGSGNIWYWGVPGGLTRASLNIDQGGRLESRSLTVGFDQPGRPAQTGTEVSIGEVTVDGIGSQIQLGGNGFARLALGDGGNGSGSMTVRNGAQVRLDAGATPGGFARIELGSNDGTSAGILRIDGAGSRVHAVGPSSQLYVGSVTNGVGVLELSNGGALDLTGSQSRMLIGFGSSSFGRAMVGAGSVLDAGQRLGVAALNPVMDSGGSGVLMVNGTARALQIAVGRQGLLGGNGTLVGQVFNRGVIAPGNTPGRLTIDGSLDTHDGRLVLEIEQQADGSWKHDELVVTDWLNSLIGGAAIEFDFLGDSDPLAFSSAGLFSMQSFFAQGDGAGGTTPLSPQALALFGDAVFSARSDRYRFSDFRFSVDDGASFTVTTVSEPTVAWLLLPGLLWVATSKRRKPMARDGRSRACPIVHRHMG